MRAVVIVPTYDEAENIGELLTAIRASAPEADVLVVDDNSPDGTAELAEKAAADLGAVEVLRRPVKDGLGNAYRAAFGRATEGGYEVIVTLDADFSHDPAVIPVLLGLVEDGADLAVGSRYVPGGTTPNWPAYRLALSRYGNRYAGWMLGLCLRDATSGFRAYRSELLHDIRYETTHSDGYAFMTELAYRASAYRADVREHPITFTDRQRGVSKMSALVIIESMLRVTWWGAKLRLHRWKARRTGRPPTG
jgi:glycosyltransferase involved in cell wall biosynthesis